MALSVAPVLGFTGVAGADEHLEAADPIGEGNFCEGVPDDNPFTDVTEADPSYEEILCLVATEVTTGVTDTTYEPLSFVTRRQMALFLTRVAAEADRLEIDDNINELPEPGANEFPDVEDEEQFIQDAISQIAEAGIAQGFDDGNYRPAEPVTRRQMAAFIDRLYTYLTGDELPANDDYFADDDEDSDEAQASTNAVAEAGIFIGNADGTFSPAQEITRRQMANVLTRTFEVLFENGEIEQWSAEEPPPSSNQTFTATADGDSTLEDGDIRQFSVSGITSDAVDIAVIDCAGVTVDENGVATFDGTNPGGTGNAADWDLAASDITVLNGASVTATNYVNNADSADGTVTFTVTADDADDCYVVVVFEDSPDNNVFELDANGEPTSDFGVTPETSVLLPEAGDGTTVTGNVTTLDKDADWFSNGINTFFYDANDEFLLAGAPGELTLEQFEARLSSGDGISGFYRNTASDQSTFTLTDSAPLEPATIDTRAPSGTAAGQQGIEVFFLESDTVTTVAYNVYRAEAIQPTITGGLVTCPDEDDFALIDTIDDENLGTDAGETHIYVDTDVELQTAPGSDDPRYCYYVTSVDMAGDEGPSSDVASDNAYAGDTSAEPEFASASAPIGSNVITVTYDEAVQCDSVDADGSGYAVTTTNGGVTTARTETAAECVGAAATDTQVEITISGAPIAAGDTVVVTAQNGDDGDTVLDVTDLAQPVGDAVLTSAVDTTAPAVVSAEETGTDELTVTFSEALYAYDGTAISTDCTDLDFAQFVVDGDATDGNDEAATSPTACTGLGTATVVFTVTGAGIDDDDVVDATFAYTDDSATLDAGDGVDASSNQAADHAAAATIDPV